MSTITTTTVKTKINNSLRRYNTSFFSESAISLPSDTLTNVDITTNLSVNTAATLRIGQITVVRKQIEIKTIVDDVTLGIKKIGRVTTLGDVTAIQNISILKQGHNTKTLNDVSISMLPHVSVNSPGIADEFGNIMNIYEDTSFGAFSREQTSAVDKNFNAFYDYPGRLDPVEYIRRGKYYRAYMIINNNVEDYIHYIEPDSIIADGAIDVFEVRSKKANTAIADIQTKGISASFASGPWDLPAGSSTELRKGTSPVESMTDIEAYEYDFFEDCQDLVFSDSKFSKKKGGSEIISGYQYSLDGYISTGKYMSPPFVDKIAKDRAYETRYQHTGNKELQAAIQSNESTRDVSVIGTRFKSNGNGSILRPKYESVIQTILGTDSIAFAGLLRE